MLDAREISNRVRGFQPFPTAFTYFHSKKLTLWKCRPIEASHETTVAGEIIKATGDDLLVFCGGDSILRIEELQLEGKRRVTARDFVNGVRPVPGDILGS